MADSTPTGAPSAHIRRLARVATCLVLGAAATGCIVLPYGPRDGRYGRGHPHYAPPAGPQDTVIVVPQVTVRPGHGR